jgi:hypothetical protein
MSPTALIEIVTGGCPGCEAVSLCISDLFDGVVLQADISRINAGRVHLCKLRIFLIIKSKSG